MDLKRPSAKDTEDDLLKMQQEFLSTKSKPAAQIVNKRKSKDEESVHTNKSESKKVKCEDLDDMQTDAHPVMIENHDMEAVEVLADIMEHDVSKLVATPPSSVSVSFPKTFTYDKKLICERKKRKSLFAMQMDRDKSSSVKSKNQKLKNISNLYEGTIMDGTGLRNKDEALQIHQENLEKLSNMSEEEILAQQQYLLKKLGNEYIYDYV
ncbi:RNA polymerase II-associated protein 1-like [Centruroides vittatus]|uniref:RNA polymerase II-associated protein 1-like n=1 Tax=Centruroides vittatus TaxID=120091 RepID=UPI00351020B8